MKLLTIRVRTLLLIVALTALFLGIPVQLCWRVIRYGQICRFHADQYYLLINQVPQTPSKEKQADWHAQMCIKYSDLREQPWLAADPDPPMPK
jgi:hypothetical protein